MSKIVGMMLLTAMTAAGHSEFDSFEVKYDFATDGLFVRLNAGREKNVNFTIPNHVFDPVEYAQAKWPEWFVKPAPTSEPEGGVPPTADEFERCGYTRDGKPK